MRDWKTSFRALWIAEFIAITGFQTSNPILPLYLGELGLSDPQAVYWWTGAINSSAAIALAVFAPIWGAVADGYGRRLMLLRAMIGGTILVGLGGWFGRRLLFLRFRSGRVGRFIFRKAVGCRRYFVFIHQLQFRLVARFA